MNIKHLSTVLLLSLTLLLVACVDSISSENETIYGTFSASPYKQNLANEGIREVIEFNESDNEAAEFIDGYSIINKGTSGTLYLGVYKQSFNRANNDAHSWAKLLQHSIKQGWNIAEDYIDDDGETVYEATVPFSGANEEPLRVSVKVHYDTIDKAYWIYLAIPDEMMEASESEKIKRMFFDARGANKK